MIKKLKNIKMAASMESIMEEGKSIADTFLMCMEHEIEPGRDFVVRVYSLMRKIEREMGEDINLDKYPSLKEDYAKWKRNLIKK